MTEESVPIQPNQTKIIVTKRSSDVKMKFIKA